MDESDCREFLLLKRHSGMVFQTYQYQGKKGNLNIHYSPDDILSIGTGSTVWDAALVLAKYLERNAVVNNKYVLELGCGTGLVGLVNSFYLGCCTACYQSLAN